MSTFADELMQTIIKVIYDAIYEKCEFFFNLLFIFWDSQVEWAQDKLSMPIDTWNVSVFSLIQNIVVKDVCIPIAAVFVTFIFCMELVHIMQDSNQMNNIKPQNIIFIFLKFAVCAIICSYSFEIVMGFYNIGTMAVEILGNQTAGKLDNIVQLSNILPPTPSTYTFGLLLTLLGDFCLILFALVIVGALRAAIYIRVMLWFLEFLIYAAAAPIPFATFNNKEWSQIGMNYTRKMLAMSFEGFFIFLMLVMYGFIAAGLKSPDTSGWLATTGSFVETLIMLIGTGFALTLMMFKAGNISASIFNAH